jgi:hypothetical protein
LNGDVTRWLAVMVLLALLASPGESLGGPVGTHAVRGVVKSVGASSLVIVRSGRKGIDMRFVLNGSTQHEGAIAVGATVSIRYVTDGRTLVATGVSAQPE